MKSVFHHFLRAIIEANNNKNIWKVKVYYGLDLNKPKSFQNICITETRLSHFHKLLLMFFKTQITCLMPKIVFYENYKHFEDSRFLENLNGTDFHLIQTTQTKITILLLINFLML